MTMSLVFNPKTFRPRRPQVSVFLWKRIPPPPFDPPSTRIWWHGHWKRIFSKTLSRVKILENAGFSFMSGRTKIRWCHISYTANPLLSPPGGLIKTLSKGKAGLNGEGVGLFKLFSETHQRELARHILRKGYYRIYTVLAFSCGRAKTIRIRYVWMHIFLKTEKKTCVFKNIRKRVAGALLFKLWIMLIITTPACNKMSRPFASYKNKKLFYEPK